MLTTITDQAVATPGMSPIESPSAAHSGLSLNASSCLQDSTHYYSSEPLYIGVGGFPVFCSGDESPTSVMSSLVAATSLSFIGQTFHEGIKEEEEVRGGVEMDEGRGGVEVDEGRGGGGGGRRKGRGGGG